MPSGRFSVSDWSDRLRHALCLVTCGILLCTPFISSVANVCVVVGAIAWLALCLLPGRPRVARKPLLLSGWVWLFLAGVLSFINTRYPAESLRGLLKLGKAFLIFAMAVEAARAEEGPRWFVRAVWLAVMLTALDGLWQYVMGRDFVQGIPSHVALGSFRRLTAGFHDPNNLGMFLGLTLPICYLYARVPGPLLRRVAVWTGLLLGAIVLFFTFSRGAVLGLLAGVTVLSVIRRDRLLIGCTCAFLLIAWCSLPQAVPQWLSHTRSPIVALANEDRLQMWHAAWHMIQAHPLVGVGIGTFNRRYAEFKLPNDPLMTSYAHDTYLQLWATIGLNGLLAFLVLCWRGWRFWRSSTPADDTRRLVSLGCLAGAAAFLTNGLLESSLSFSKLSMLFWLISGMALGASCTPTTKPVKPSD